MNRYAAEDTYMMHEYTYLDREVFLVTNNRVMYLSYNAGNLLASRYPSYLLLWVGKSRKLPKISCTVWYGTASMQQGCYLTLLLASRYLHTSVGLKLALCFLLFLIA